MIRLIGWATVIYLLFYFGIVQFLAIWSMVALSWIASI
jgi:hypothetical protein